MLVEHKSQTQTDLFYKTELQRQENELKQSFKLNQAFKAYDAMKRERSLDRQHREQMREAMALNHLAQMSSNYQKAETIRIQESQLQQQKKMNQYLHAMNVKQEQEMRQTFYSDCLRQTYSRIESLEHREKQLMETLKNTMQ